MKILVTGGAGFIGSHVVRTYLEAGHTVAVLDNLATGKLENIPEGVKFYQGDVSNREFVSVSLTEFEPDVVNHHAGQASVTVSSKHPEVDMNTNIGGMIALLEGIRLLPKFKKIIYSNTGGAMYGNPESLPCAEDAFVMPISPYGLSKYTAERYLWLYAHLYQIVGTVLRYANVYGPNQDAHGEAGVCAIFTDRMLAGQPVSIYGDGAQLRDYVYVGDVARANLLALDLGDGDSVNIGSGKPMRTNEVFETLKEATGYKLDAVHEALRTGEIEATYLSVEKAQEVLGWEAQTSFEEGIRQTVAWAKKRPTITA